MRKNPQHHNKYSTEAWQEKIWPSLFVREQRAERGRLRTQSSVLSAGGARPAPTETEQRPAATTSASKCVENITKNRIIAILIHKVTFYNVIKANKKGKSK